MFAIIKFLPAGVFINAIFLNQEVKGGISKLLNENPSLVTAAVTTLTTIVLAYITWRYLRETRKMREIASKSFELDHSPRAFVDDIVPSRNINTDRKLFLIKLKFIIKNFGKTEAENIEVSYKFSCGDVEPKVKKFKPAPFLFPDKTIWFETGFLGVGLSDEQIAIAEKAKATGKGLQIPSTFAPPIIIDLNIKYFDHEKKEKSHHCLFRYNWDSNSFDYMSEEETESSESPQNQKGGQ